MSLKCFTKECLDEYINKVKKKAIEQHEKIRFTK